MSKGRQKKQPEINTYNDWEELHESSHEDTICSDQKFWLQYFFAVKNYK